MKKKQTSKQLPINLRRSPSNQLISMQIIHEVSPEPYFVRKQYQEAKLIRGNSLTARKNKLVQTKKVQSNKQKPSIQKNKPKNQQKEDNKKKIRMYNSPLKSQRYPTNSCSQIQTNTTQLGPQNISQLNFSDEKISSCKSVKFSNRLEDNASIHTKRDTSRTPSILKNKSKKIGNGSVLSNIPSQRSFSINQSFHSNHKQIKKKIAQQSNINLIIKKKFQCALKTLQAKQNKNKPPLPGKRNYKTQHKQKFQDQLFPPSHFSVFPYNPKAQKIDGKRGKQIEWKRISEVFPNKKLVIFDRPEAVPKYFDITKQQSKVTKISITREKNSYAAQYIVTAFNAIKNNDQLLLKIFQIQQVNDFGIYMLKIFQQNAWKYIIIDDFIPVVKSNLINTDNPYVPAFINVKPEALDNTKKGKRNNAGEYLPIWPFLLQKAYASYYSSYQALTYGNPTDIVQEFCGISCQKIDLAQKTDAEQYLEVIDKLLLILKNGNIVVLAQLKQTLPMIPLYYKAQFFYSMITEEQLIYYDPAEDYKPSKIKFYDLGLICTHLFLYSPSKYLQQIQCSISKPKHKISANLINKINKEDDIIPRDLPTIRKFCLNSSCQCTIFVRQKDNRFLHRLSIQYIWIRAVLIGKQYDGSYRWVDGQYSNKKSISFSHVLDSGEYFMLIWPEWSKQKYHHQLHLSVFSNQNIQNFQRISHDPKQKMLELACMDLAQKKGKLNQINQFICSYNYVDKKSAMIIENINNQRLHGQVNIVRSILGLKSKVQIVPVNDQFFQELKDKQKQQGAQYLAIKKTNIDVKIPKRQSYTVILKMRGGIDHKFFRAFTFGS